MQAPNGGRGDVYSISADGSGLRNLTRTADPAEVDPTWSPDGGRIAFVTR